MSIKNSTDTIGNRTPNLPDCAAVPQTIATRRAPHTKRVHTLQSRPVSSLDRWRNTKKLCILPRHCAHLHGSCDSRNKHDITSLKSIIPLAFIIDTGCVPLRYERVIYIYIVYEKWFQSIKLREIFRFYVSTTCPCTCLTNRSPQTPQPNLTLHFFFFPKI